MEAAIVTTEGPPPQGAVRGHRFLYAPPFVEYSAAELLQLLGWIASDGQLRTDEQITDEMVDTLGFARRGKRIETAIQSAIALATSGLAQKHLFLGGRSLDFATLLNHVLVNTTPEGDSGQLGDCYKPQHAPPLLPRVSVLPTDGCLDSGLIATQLPGRRFRCSFLPAEWSELMVVPPTV